MTETDIKLYLLNFILITSNNAVIDVIIIIIIFALNISCSNTHKTVIKKLQLSFLQSNNL